MNFKIVLISICLCLLQENGLAAVIAAPLVAPGVPVVRPVPLLPVVPVGIPRPLVINRFGFVVKREVNSNFTECVINTDEHKLTCTGQHELTCEISKRLSRLGSPLSVIVKDLKIKLAKTKSENNDILLNIHAEKEVNNKITVEDYTFLNPLNNKPMFLSLYSSDNFKNKLGFQFKEKSCLNKFKEFFDEGKKEDISLQLVIKFEDNMSSTMETTTSTSADSTTAAIDSTTEAATARDVIDTTTETAHDATTIASAIARDAATTTEAAHDATTIAGAVARDAIATTTEAAHDATTITGKVARAATTTEAAHDATTIAGAVARDAIATTTEAAHDAIITTAAATARDAAATTTATAHDATAVDATSTTTAANKI